MVRSSHAVLLSVAVASAVGLAGCKGGESKAIAAAKAKAEANALPAAEIELKSVLQKNPKSAEARYLLGMLLMRRGDAAAALIELTRARELQYPDAKVLPPMAQAQLLAGKSRQVIDTFGDQTIDDVAANAELRATVASAHAMEGDIAKARQVITTALKAAPQSIALAMMQARIEASAGNLTEALRMVDQLLASHPGEFDAWALKGDLLSYRGTRQADAEAAYLKALGIKSDAIGVRFSLAGLYLVQRATDKVQVQINEIRKHSPNSASAAYLEAQLAVANREFARARTLYQAILRAVPENVMYLVGASEAELQLNSQNQAESLAAKAVALAPGSVPARRMLAQAQLSMGHPAKAVATLEPVVERADAPTDVLALAATARMMNGNTRGAEALHKRLAELKPDDLRVRTLIATSGLAKGDNTSALAELQSISQADKGTSADMVIINTRLRNRQFDEALKAIDVLERKDPGRPVAYQLRGIVLAQKKDFAGARKSFDQALSKDPDYLPVVTALAALDLLDKKPQEAIKRIEDVVKRKPKDANALLWLADFVAETGGKREDVDKVLARAVKADSSNAAAWSRYISHQLAAGDPHAAQVTAQNAVTAIPDDVDLAATLGRIQLTLGANDLALATFSKIVAAYPKSAPGHVGQAQAYLAANKLTEAAASVAHALELQPTLLQAQRLSISIAIRQGRHAQAKSLAKTIQSQRPGEAVGYLLEGEVEMAQQHWEPAATALKKAITLPNPGDAPARLYYALERGGNAKAAAAMANDWLKANPSDASLRFHLGTAAERSGDAATAERHYREVLAQNPNSVSALNNLAMVLIGQNKPTQGRELAERAVAIAPGEAALLDTLALAYSLEKNLAMAVKTQERAISLAPRDSLYRLGLAKIYLRAQDRAKAKTELDKALAMTDSPDTHAEAKQLMQSLKRW